VKVLAVFVLGAVAASAQLGGPSRYPQGNPGSGVPFPGRGKKQSTTSKTKEPAKPLANFTGTLKRIDSKAFVLVLGDYRELEFKRTDKTSFLKKGEPAKPETFKVGDEVLIEAFEDVEAFLTAVNVHWEKAGAEPAAETKAPAAIPTDEAAPPQTVMIEPKPAPRDVDDPGPPKLQRGKPASRPPTPTPSAKPEEPQQVASAPVVEAPAVPLPSVVAPSATTVERIDGEIPQRKEDALIRKAQDTALEFTETLPNYICKEVIARFQSETNPANWRAIDVVGAEVVYEKGKEHYRNITINGKPVKKGMEELSGSWSTGEFGTVLIDILSPATAADFRSRGESRIAAITARKYDFEVARENSHWTIRSGSQTYRPAYRGAIWIDPKTARVLRIEMQSRGLPEEFPLDKVESATDYQYVRLGGTQEFLLPVHAETLSCQRGTSICSRNTIDFRNYHKYSGQSSIEFEKQ
jgi:hypothetical protein